MIRQRLMLGVLLVGLATGLVGAQNPVYTLNGQVDASCAVGSNLEVAVTATPGAALFVVFNVNPGPTIVLGVPVPVANDAFLIVSHAGVPIPGNGQFVDYLPIPGNPFLEGFKLNSVAVTADPTLPLGFGFSNGTTVTFVRAPDAGTATAGFVGQGIALDASAMVAGGALLPGAGVQWTIQSGPAGHAATLGGATTLFPTLTADLPGVYTLEVALNAAGTTGGATDTVVVSVYDINLTSHAQGGFDVANTLNFAANLAGPTPTTFEAIGVATAVGANLTGSTPATSPATHLALGVTDPSGQFLGRGWTIHKNVGGPVATPPQNSAAFHFRQIILDQIEGLIETALAQIDLSGALTGIPAIPVVSIPGLFGTTLFSATVQPQSFSYDPTIDVEFTASTAGLGVQMTLTNVVFTFTQTGLLFNAPYTDTGTMTIPSMQINFNLVTTVVGNQYQTTATSPTATLTGATLTYTTLVIPGAFQSTFNNLANTLIGAAIANLVAAAFPPILDAGLNAIPQSLDLSAQGVNLVLDFAPGSVVYSAGGITFALSAGAHASTPSPLVAPIPGIVVTPNPLPAYTGLAPGGAAYDLALAVGDDFLNATMAALMQTGALEASLGGTIDLGTGTPVAANAGSFALFFPGVGFEKFDPSAPVVVKTHPTVAPFFRVGAPTGELLQLFVSDLIADLEVEVEPGYSVSVARIGFEGSTGINAAFNATTGALDLTPGTAAINAYAVSSMPGVDLTPIVSTFGGLIGTILPTLINGAISIPLPTGTGTTGGSVVGLHIDGPAMDYISIEIDLP